MENNMTEYTSRDVVDFALNGEAANAKEAIESVLQDKVADALDVQRTSIARNWLKSEEE